MTEKAGWTPNQIRELSIGQISEYLNMWGTKQKKETTTISDAEIFNLESGIESITMKKPN